MRLDSHRGPDEWAAGTAAVGIAAAAADTVVVVAADDDSAAGAV